ncbi:MAG: ribosome maturation factor RimP [Elusimicrobia bacterium]|nr:ribosome maturation factor RimP [Elusimicrobiota bacterium]
MDKEKIIAELEELLEKEGYELVDLKFSRARNKTLLQVFIDRKDIVGDITLDECGQWSNKIGSYFDVSDSIGESYILEISSPGLDRVIKKEKDFIRFAGKKVKVKLKNPYKGSRVYRGALCGFEDGRVILSDELEFKIEDIAEVRLEPAEGVF